MKKLVFLVALIPTLLLAQFDFYGPKPFNKILDQKFTANWTPTALSNIVNRKYVVILDQATKSNVLSLSATNIAAIENTSLTAINGVNATYKSLMNSVFQIVDKTKNYQEELDIVHGAINFIENPSKQNKERLLSQLIHNFEDGIDTLKWFDAELLADEDIHQLIIIYQNQNNE